MNHVAIRLWPEDATSRSNVNPFTKFKVSCQDRITVETPDTRDWLQLESRINHDSPEYALFYSHLQRHNVVVKVGSSILQREYDIGTFLESLELPTFLSHHCIFHCLDNPQGLRTDPLPRPLCSVIGEPIHIIVMPELKGKSFEKYRWTNDSVLTIKNILKHVVLSLCVASTKLKFVHKDLHLHNVIIVRSRRRHISYGEYGTLPVAEFIPIIMDYDRSIVNSSKPHDVYGDMKRYIFDVDREFGFRTDDLKQLLADLKSERQVTTPDVCRRILEAIDSMRPIEHHDIV